VIRVTSMSAIGMTAMPAATIAVGSDNLVGTRTRCMLHVFGSLVSLRLLQHVREPVAHLA